MAIHKSSLGAQEECGQEKGQRYSIEDSIFVKSKNRLQKLCIKDVLWVEASDIYALLITGNNKFIVNYALKVIDDKFTTEHFMRIHRSYFVNHNAVEAVEGHQLIVASKAIEWARAMGRN